ncbi:hypothetical protein BJX99DRAFT_222267 [Aspergillus californicus]
MPVFRRRTGIKDSSAGAKCTSTNEVGLLRVLLACFFSRQSWTWNFLRSSGRVGDSEGDQTKPTGSHFINRLLKSWTAVGFLTFINFIRLSGLRSWNRGARLRLLVLPLIHLVLSLICNFVLTLELVRSVRSMYRPQRQLCSDCI